MNTSPSKKPGLREALGEYIAKSKLRLTPERLAVVEAAEALTGRFTVETLIARVKEGPMGVSPATVYNTVELMVESGILRRLAPADGRSAAYEKATMMARPRLLLVCSACGSTKEIKDPELVKLLDRRRFQSFDPEYYDLKIFGICSKCQRRRRRVRSV